MAGREGRALGGARERRRGRLPRRGGSPPRPTRTPHRPRSTAPSKGSEKRSPSAPTRTSTTRSTDEGAVGIVEDFAVFGTEAEFKRTVDAVKGDGLDADDELPQGDDGLDDDRLGTFYVDVKAMLDAGRAPGSRRPRSSSSRPRLFPIDKVGPITGQFLADGERLAVDATAEVPEDALAGGLGALTGGGSTPLLGELPGDSWVALGSPDFGPTMQGRSTSRPPARSAARRSSSSCARELGIDLEEDVFSWIGDVAFFARGTSQARSTAAS